jgi:hypothetical protein
MVASASRRDTSIVAWHEVPGKACLGKEPSRRVRYDRAHLIPEVFLVEMCAVFSLKRLNTLLERFVSDDCHGKNCIVGAKWHNINLKRFTIARSNRIDAHTDTDHTVPYGTTFWGGAAPGTSCQATIVLSLRDILQQALA